jgi:hypothetical protein
MGGICSRHGRNIGPKDIIKFEGGEGIKYKTGDMIRGR